MQKSARIADADAGRLVAWAVSTLSMPNDDKGNPVSERTPEWAVGRWIEITVLDAFAAATEFERSRAAKQAHEDVVPMSVTMT